MKKNCLSCGNEFEKIYSNHKYCSKKCSNKIQHTKYYFNNIEKCKSIKKNWYNKNKILTINRAKLWGKNNLEKLKMHKKDWILNNPDKVKLIQKNNNKKYKSNPINKIKLKCHSILNYDILKNPTKYKNYCEICNKTDVRIEQHHEDYTKPYEVIALCRKCHINLHLKKIENGKKSISKRSK